MRRLPDRFLVTVVLSVLLCSFVGLIARWTPFSDLNNWTYDFLINHGGYKSPSPDVVLIDFDDLTFSKVQQYPMPRTIIAQVIQKLGDAKPAIIGLDVFLSEARTDAEDLAMRNALASAGNVVLASQAPTGQLPGVLPLPAFCRPEDPDLPTGFCAEDSKGAFAYAAINMPNDNDGFVRNMELFAYGKKAAESFPVFMTELYLKQLDENCRDCELAPLGPRAATLHGFPVPYSNVLTRTVLIGHWSPTPVTRYSAWDVLSGAVGQEQIAGKLVLVGQGSDAARDQHFTPLFRMAGKDGKRERVSGTALHAAAVETLLHGEAIAPLRGWLVWAINLIVVACCAYLVMWLSLRGALLATLALMAAIYLIAQLAFSQGHIWMPYLTTEMATAAAFPAGMAYRYIRERLMYSESEEQREQLMGLFSRYVDPEVAQTIWLRRDEVSLLGQEKVATVLFTDIRGFTAMTAGQPSHIVLRWLNEYFTEMDALIRKHGGLLNKFIGDGLLVVYGVPLSRGLKEDACEAVRTAFAMLQRLEDMNRDRVHRPELPELHIGIGIHTGALTCGSVGSLNRQEYSVIGETVNLASRLESLNKEFHTEIIMSESTYAIVKDVFPGLYEVGSTPVRGFTGPLLIYSAKSGEQREVLEPHAAR